MKKAARKKPASLGPLDAPTANRLVGASSDVALVLDGSGTILDVMTHDEDIAPALPAHWRGRSWSDIVTVESRPKVESLLRDAAEVDTSPRWRQVNHPLSGAPDLPVLYTAVQLQDGDECRIVAFGRNLRAVTALQGQLLEAQRAMERDYWRFREAETRYRHLFETSTECVLIVDGETLRILEANPVARTVCGAQRSRLVGSGLLALFESKHGAALQSLLAGARTTGRKDLQRATLAGSGLSVDVSVSAIRQEAAVYALVRLNPVAAGSRRGRTAAVAPAEASASLLQAFVDQSADALVFTDPQGRILGANRAFLTLAQLGGEDQARGERLDRWLGRTGVELDVLIANLRQRGSAGLFVTTLRGEYGASAEVEISASLLQQPGGSVLAFAVRDIERRLQGGAGVGPAAAVKATPRSVEQLAELVGRVPLKEIVADTTDLIEQMCIETALHMTRDNRASAAQLLGLSRQSLYVKLRRFGMGEVETED